MVARVAGREAVGKRPRSKWQCRTAPPLCHRAKWRAAGIECASPQRSVRITDDSRWARDNHLQAEVDDLFAQWESDPLQLLSFPDLGM